MEVKKLPLLLASLFLLCLAPTSYCLLYGQVYSIKPQNTFKINVLQLITREILISYEQGYENRNASEFSIGYRISIPSKTSKPFEFFYPIDYDRITPIIPASSGFFGGYTWKHYSKTRKPKIDYFLAACLYARYQFYNDAWIYQKSKLKDQNYLANQSLHQYQLGIKLLTGKRFYHFNAFQNSGWMYELYGGIGFRLQQQSKTMFYQKFDTQEQAVPFPTPQFEKKFNIFPTVHLGLSVGFIFNKINTGN